jgi:hypothetical protein
VVGFDVAGDEGTYPMRSASDPMAAAVKRAAESGVPVTVHAGEWPEKYGTVDNVRHGPFHGINYSGFYLYRESYRLIPWRDSISRPVYPGSSAETTPPDHADRDRCYEYPNIFAKKLAKKLTFLTQNTGKLCINWIITLFFF